MAVRSEASPQQKRRYSISLAVIALAIAALVVGGAVFYANKPAVTATITSTSTQVVTLSSTVTKNIIPRDIMNGKQLLPQPYQTFHDAWLLFAPTGNGSYVLTIHIEGLSPSQGSTDYYVVKGVLDINNTVEQVPLAQPISNSILQVDARGVGNFYIILKQDPSLVYEAIEIAHVNVSGTPPSTVVGTASLIPPTIG